MAAKRDDVEPLTPRAVTVLAIAAPIVGVLALILAITELTRGDATGWLNLVMAAVLLTLGALFIRAVRLARAVREHEK